MNLATAHRAADQSAAELKALDAVLDMDRLHFMAWLRKGQLYQRHGNQSQAVLAWRAAVQLADNLQNVSADVARDLAAGRAFLEETGGQLVTAVEGAFTGFLDAADPQSQRRVDAFVKLATGRRQVYVNQCAGLYYPFLPADEYFDDFHFPWFADLNAKTPAIRAEFEALYADPGESLRPYIRLDKGGPEAQWSALNNSLDWGALFLWEFGRPNEAVLARCPVTADAIRSIPSAFIPGRAPNVMFSILRPGAHIPPHTGVTNTRAVVHLPLIVPEQCGFRVGGETRPWQPGRAFAFDDTIEHEAWNNSADFRAILMFDVWNPHLTEIERNAILNYFDAIDALGFGGQAGTQRV
jgi:aspartyl/asparaginyl beta-hydroxylase (cupin superfamily)